MRMPKSDSCASTSSLLRTLFTSALFLSSIPLSECYTQNRFFANNPNPKPRPARWGPPEKRAGSIPLKVTNKCPEKMWPGIGTQAGTGAGTGGFELEPGESKSLAVSADWQGRVWGRTNCSFNVAGTGASNLNGNNGGGAACSTGDCGGVLSCVNTVSISSSFGESGTDVNRALHPLHSPSSILQEGPEGSRPSTTSRL